VQCLRAAEGTPAEEGGMKRTLKPHWSCSDFENHEHRTKFEAWLCGSRQALAQRSRKPPTPQEGRAILDDAIRQTLDNGLSGYVAALLSDGKEGEVVLTTKGDITEGLNRLLELLLENPQTKAGALAAIVGALKTSGKVQTMQIVGPEGCECPICTARRAKEERQTTSTTH
jgi:hypothetical protein